MKLTSQSFAHNAPIPTRFAFGKHDPATHVALSDNRNPHLAFDEVPEGTQSFALLVHDPDVPSKPDDVNQEGRTVPSSLPRVDFYHWVLVDIPASVRSIDEGAHAEGITARGKSASDAPSGMRHGLNDYTGWFEGDADMGGQYFGYDGPCPPWNDEIVHHYHFTLYALDVPRLAVDGAFDGPIALAAMEGHVLAKAELVGTYAVYPDAKDLRG